MARLCADDTIEADLVVYASVGGKALDEVMLATRRGWKHVTDSANTNDYFCFRLLAFFSAVTFSITQSVNPIPLLDSPPAAMS